MAKVFLMDEDCISYGPMFIYGDVRATIQNMESAPMPTEESALLDLCDKIDRRSEYFVIGLRPPVKYLQVGRWVSACIQYALIPTEECLWDVCNLDSLELQE